MHALSFPNATSSLSDTWQAEIAKLTAEHSAAETDAQRSLAESMLQSVQQKVRICSLCLR